MGIIRNWQCENAACNAVFESWEPHPECPKCGCVRIQWVPGGGHVAGTAKAADAELRLLADTYGLTNLNSAERGRQSKQIAPEAAHALNAPQKQFAPGFQTPIMTDVNGRPVATCLPSTGGMTAKVKAGVGNRLSASRSVPGAHANTRVEARHTGRA